MIWVLGIDAPTVGIGALAAGLVTVTGYMLFNARDSDRRVDDAQREIGKVLADQRDEARLERDRARAECEKERRWRAEDREKHRRAQDELRAETTRAYEERNEALERVRILQLRLGLQPEEGTEP